MASASPGASSNAHTRTYQACLQCRKRKVRCNLGPVDNPHDPPCDRCRRESKECYFSAERRKKRDVDSGDTDDLDTQDFEVRGGRKRLKTDDDTPESLARGYSAFPLAPGSASRGRLSSSTIGGHGFAPPREREDEQVSAQTAAILQNAEVHSGHDALNVLLEAATHHRAGSNSTGSRPHDMTNMRSPHPMPSASPVMHRSFTNASDPYRPVFSPGQPQIDPAIVTDSTAEAAAAGRTSALKAWSRFKFVRAGWFSAQEAIAYVNFFYTRLSPLTPIVMQEFASPGTHARMLEEEPMLAITILTIASRHMPLEGSGAMSRPHAIHHKLWSYLEGMINRLVWGQEQFGHTTSITGSQPGSDIVPYNRRGLRTLGTVESLMLLTEWHPRSMHFPPDDDDSELLLPDYGTINPDTEILGEDSSKGIGGHRMETWLEPCWRSDRICWMLLSMAMSLAFEIGVFDENTSRHLYDKSVTSDDRRQTYEIRRLHVKDLLLVYNTQTSGRVGLTSMLPKHYCEPALSHIFDLRNVRPGHTKDLVIHLWLKIASIMKTGNEDLFANRTLTRDIIRTGRYGELLQNLCPTLLHWRRTMDAAKDIPPLMQHVLNIDFEYCRVYLNSLGLQAVIERCTKNLQPHNPKAGAASMSKALAGDVTIPAGVLEQCYGHDRFYVNEVIDGCRKLLKCVVEGLWPGEHLRHAPVRTYFRIISVAIILLKTFALGASEHDVAISLSLLDKTCQALRQCIVDDVHVASRFAELLSTLTDRIRDRFVRYTRGGGNSSNGPTRRTSKSPIDAPGMPTSQPVNASAVTSSLSAAAQAGVGHGGGSSWILSSSQGNSRRTSGGNANANGVEHNNPLHGISTQTFDFEDGAQFNVMPPPTNPSSPSLGRMSLAGGAGGMNGMYGYQDQGGYIDENGNYPDWLALPLDPIINSYGADVTQNGYGPGVGEYDMLELLLGTGGSAG